MLYYCYNSQPCGKGGVLSWRAPAGSNVTATATLGEGRNYRDATRLNSVLKVFGAVLLNATSTGVYRVLPPGSPDTGVTHTCETGEKDCPHGEQPSTDLSPSRLASVVETAVSSSKVMGLPGNGLLIGEFALPDGRSALLLHNQNWDMTIYPGFTFTDSPLASVLEVDPITGAEAVVMDQLFTGEPPDHPGVRLLFGAAEARLLILPKSSAER